MVDVKNVKHYVSLTLGISCKQNIVVKYNGIIEGIEVL